MITGATILNQPITIYKNKSKADKDAAILNADADDGDKFVVEERKDGRFVIAVYHDGMFVFCL